MEITEERKADVLILRVIQKLDASTSKEPEDKLLSHVAANRGKLVVDL